MQSKINIKLTFNSFDPKLTIWQEYIVHMYSSNNEINTTKAYCTKNTLYKNRLISFHI